MTSKQTFLKIREIPEETRGREGCTADRLCVITEANTPRRYYSYYFSMSIFGTLVIMIGSKFYFRVSFTGEPVTFFLPEGKVKSEGVSVLL